MIEYSVELSRMLLRKVVASVSSRLRWVICASSRFWSVMSRAAAKTPRSRPSAPVKVVALYDTTVSPAVAGRMVELVVGHPVLGEHLADAVLGALGSVKYCLERVSRSAPRACSR
jgi:hypothetical protein